MRFSYGNIFLSYVNELCICLEICLSSRFMSIVLWPGMTHPVPLLSQNACCGRGAWCSSLSFEVFLFSNHQLANRYISESEVAQSCPTLCHTMDCSLPGSSLYGILQARVLEWVAISFSRGSSRPRDGTPGSPTFQVNALTSEPPGKPRKRKTGAILTLPHLGKNLHPTN